MKQDHDIIRRALPDSPRATALATGLLYLLFLAARLATCNFDPSRFVTAGDFHADRAEAPPGLSILEDSVGYDGQFYYRLALDPFTRERTAFGITLDSPLYRSQRILYPLLAWMLSLGRPALVPAALILVNLAALCLMGWAGGMYARGVGRHALWGVLFPLYGGYLLSISRDTTEPLGAALLLCALAGLQRGRTGWAGVLLVLALLARETALLMAPAALIVCCIDLRRRPGSHPWHLFAAPAFAYAGWQAFLHWRWQATLGRDADLALGPPLTGFLASLRQASGCASGAQVLRCGEMALVLLFTVAVVWAWRASSAGRIEKTAWLLYLALMASLAAPCWAEDWGFLRGMSEFYILGAAILLGSSTAPAAAARYGSLAFWLVLAAHVLRRP